jgi:hypothetical protein
MRRRRKVAIRRFMRTLAEIGYNIPAKLLHSDALRGHDGMRKSAASCLLLAQDRLRISSLVVSHYSDSPLKKRQSQLYCHLRNSFSMRSAEAAVAPLNAITPDGDFVVFPDGFALLKGPNAKRFGPLDPEVAEDFRATAVAVARARPGAKWVFLQDDRTDWRFINEIEGAYSAAVKQVTGESDGRPHSSRAITPLAALFPNWEGFIRNFLNGKVTTQECEDFCQRIRQQGFNALVVQLVRIGHGHPNTFIQYYFSIWDLLLSIYSQASLLRVNPDASVLATATGSTCAAAFRQAARRAKAAGTPHDQWMWMTTYRPASTTYTASLPSVQPMKLQPLQGKAARTVSQVRAGTKSAVSESNRVMYVTLRLTGLDETTAADSADITTSTARDLEQLIDPGAVGTFGARQQFRSDKAGGKVAELKYLRSDEGWALVRQLLKAPEPLAQQLAEALTPRRAGSYVLPPLLETRRSLVQFASNLPPSLGVLIQFGSGRHNDSETRQIEDASMRVFVGDSDPDLGPRPRLFIVPTIKPMGLVARPRRTANTRAVLAGIQLLRNHFIE